MARNRKVFRVKFLQLVMTRCGSFAGASGDWATLFGQSQ